MRTPGGQKLYYSEATFILAGRGDNWSRDTRELWNLNLLGVLLNTAELEFMLVLKFSELGYALWNGISH